MKASKRQRKNCFRFRNESILEKTLTFVSSNQIKWLQLDAPNLDSTSIKIVFIRTSLFFLGLTWCVLWFKNIFALTLQISVWFLELKRYRYFPQVFVFSVSQLWMWNRREQTFLQTFMSAIKVQVSVDWDLWSAFRRKFYYTLVKRYNVQFLVSEEFYS